MNNLSVLASVLIECYLRTQKGKMDRHRFLKQMLLFTALLSFQPFSVGAAVMLGYEWKCGLQINASCKVGILDQFDAWKAKATILPYRIGLGAAWRFGH